jgi:hypothetical protein
MLKFRSQSSLLAFQHIERHGIRKVRLQQLAALGIDPANPSFCPFSSFAKVLLLLLVQIVDDEWL